MGATRAKEASAQIISTCERLKELSKRTKWIVVIAVVFAIAAAVVVIAGLRLSRRLGPYLREQTIAYLEDRFDATVELGSLQITSPAVSPRSY